MCSLRAIQTVGDMLGDNTDREPIIRSASVAAAAGDAKDATDVAKPTS